MSVGLQSRIRGSLLRVVSYNPMLLIQSRRALDISEELSADLIRLQGTRSRFVPRPGVGDRYTVRRHPRHWELSWGWQNTRHSNRSAGCSIFVKTRRWRERDLCQVYSTPAVLQGRVGGARLRTGRSDVAMLVAYFPPKPSQQKEWRCTPFVATDLNTQLGIEAGRHEPRWTPEVGTRGASIEDETATMFRSVLKQHRLIAINTHFDDRYTFYNSSGSGRSRIDFVCMPQELFEAVSHAGICEGAGRRLQLVNVCRLFDHVPVQVSLSYSLDHTGFSQEAEERLNRDQLRKCITHGEKRVELVQAVASELESLREEMDRQLREKTPDAIVMTFTSALMKAAKAVFGIMQGVRGRTAAQKAEAKQVGCASTAKKGVAAAASWVL